MKIAFIIDKKGWVQHDRSLILKSILPLNVDIITFDRLKNIRQYDVLYFFSVALLEKTKIYHNNILSSITSYKNLCIKSLPEIMARCRKCSVNNLFFYRQLKTFNNLIYLPNGVDTAFFSYCDKRLSTKPVIGWVGNVDREAKNYSVVKKLKKENLPMSIISVETKKGSGKKLDKQRMLGFYHKLDYYLVCSSNEGTPNPALEAASCGVPLISTKVGNMPEIINERNGIFIKSDRYNDVKNTVFKTASIGVEKHNIMRKEIRKIMSEEWDWRFRKEEYISFLTK